MVPSPEDQRPPTARSSDVLPQPDGPITSRLPPGGSSRSRRSTRVRENVGVHIVTASSFTTGAPALIGDTCMAALQTTPPRSYQ